MGRPDLAAAGLRRLPVVGRAPEVEVVAGWRERVIVSELRREEERLEGRERFS